MEPTYPNLPRSVGCPKMPENAGIGSEQVVQNVSSEPASTAPSNTPTPPKASQLTASLKVK